MYNHQLDTFIKIADLGSFGKAAEAMYISSPAILQQINLLEQRCGFKLFVRSNHGVKLTSAGKSLYEDAKTLIRLSEDALNKARLLAESSEHTVRVGTSLLYKCRLIPEIWAWISERLPELRIEILPMAEYQNRSNSFSMLGIKYDMWEGIYGTGGWKGICQFLELARTPICCAVAKNHRFAKTEKLTLQDLNGEYLVMPIKGVSEELDAFRNEIIRNHPTIQIIDSAYYGIDTFTMCEVNPYILITQPVYSDIHTNLVIIPLETEYTLPYGLIYANEPTIATQKLIATSREFLNTREISALKAFQLHPVSIPATDNRA
ncbi:LysR family transcriptional regulator [Parablautia muri]|uniref:LysR family transcriptional regulator n=1 Tax=Parablautia muri TaxID=2320879 RepID=A0A9X5BFC0_9FIRM|nr:LysR family transcriptional regulator [Parablautia muri]NBJ92880.1 LysR family transcriptional regulator [Parablautia muri]